MKVWLVLAATWIWWAAIVGPAAWVCASSLSETACGHNNNLSINKVEFHVTGCTRKSYTAFIQSLRTNLSSGTSVHGIPLLPAQSGSQQDLLLVQLFDWGNMSITLVLNRTNAYVIAYQSQNSYYLLADTPENPELYGSNWHRLSFTGSYTALQKVANEKREYIDVGIDQLATAILTLNYWSSPMVERFVARYLIVLIQMVSEAARFEAVEEEVAHTIFGTPTPFYYGSFRPNVFDRGLETNWEKLSTAVQQSNQGKFLQPVELPIMGKGTVVINDTEQAQTYCGLALLLYLRPSQASLSSHDFSAFPASRDPNIRPMLDFGA